MNLILYYYKNMLKIYYQIIFILMQGDHNYCGHQNKEYQNIIQE